ncbi:dihydropteroate synthase [Sutterella sp.]|uniref:dihydropteroate synthase n=1 Tax=Sutterella sp. TaxID=1981025 RepID=UPI0026E0CEBC|nr:dihydropteroate synthase [Sutterella sp.]MDO5531519.1 dihydropteroate synthase [Sutterella sp.]
MSAPVWKISENELDLTSGPIIMGILNVTPDSFSDGGEHNLPVEAINHAQRMRDEGAVIIDVGGESTRPGSGEVSLEEERRRVMPVIEALCRDGAIVSVDTSKPEIMTEAAALGAQILNDVRAFTLPGAAEAAAATDCGLVIMHRTEDAPRRSDDVVGDVLEYLMERERVLTQLGVERSRICLDPGFGFGKTPEENFELIAWTERFIETGLPVMTALSRKSSLGAVTGRKDPHERVVASVAGALLAVERGAHIVRVHDVAETFDAFSVREAVHAAYDRRCWSE